MINKKIHAKLYILKALFIAAAFSFVQNSVLGQEKEQYKLRTIVIDPGHGGKDPGAVGKITQEKHLVLKIALKFGEYIEKNYEDVKVIYTRKTDSFIPLFRRAEIANKNHADLFISLHINANRSYRIKGTETYAMGLHKSQSNLEVAKKENAVIYYEEDYSQKYEGFNPKSAESYIIFSLAQNTYLEQSLNFASFVQEEFTEETNLKNRGVKQAGFLVLWKTTMPSVLIEAGFISNPEEEKYLMTDKAQDKLAKSIFKAFESYKEKIERKSIMLAKSNEPADTNAVSFKLQVASAPKPIPLDSDYFNGYSNVEEHQVDGQYKYTIGDFNKYQDVVEQKDSITQDFPGAFVVAYRNGKPISLQKAIKFTDK